MVQKHLLDLYLARTAAMLSGARRVATTLLVTLLLTMTAQTAWAGELTETSGTSGACTWSFNTTTGQLTISGSGDMAD